MANAQPTPAKISRPKLYGALRRKRLFELLDRCRAHPLVWIAAPPGAGKTTLVASYLEERKVSPIWYQMDAEDGDPATFFYYLALAAARFTPRKRRPLPLLRPEFLSDLPAFTRRF